MWLKVKKNEYWVIFLASIVLLVLFRELLDSYLDNDGLIMIDRPVNEWISNTRTPVLSRIMLFVTMSGNWQMIIWSSLLGAVLLAAANKYRYLITMMTSNTLGVLFTEWIKNLIDRPRPPITNALLQERGFAFPSGHSYFAVVFYGLIVYFWVKNVGNRKLKVIGAIVGGLFVLMLALSRIYLGVHWTTDVLGGISLSGTWLAMTIAYLESRKGEIGLQKERFSQMQLWQGVLTAGILWLSGMMLLYWQILGQVRL